MQSVAPLIAGAWEHNHRRRTRLLLAATASAIAMFLIWWASGLGRTTAGGARPPGGNVIVRPSAVLARSPYTGIATCHPDSRTCYRIGLAVWLREPAQSIRATSESASSMLNRTDHRGIEMISRVRRREFIGFFTPAGIVPPGYLRTPDANPEAPIATVKLTIANGHGQTVITRLRLPVQAGWG